MIDEKDCDVSRFDIENELDSFINGNHAGHAGGSRCGLADTTFDGRDGGHRAYCRHCVVDFIVRMTRNVNDIDAHIGRGR